MKKLLLVEALPKSEGVSEAALLENSIDVLKRGSDQRVARSVKVSAVYPETKQEFLKAIQRDCDYLHISAHGSRYYGKGRLFVRGGGEILPKDLDKVTIPATTIFVNACDGLSGDLSDSFIRNTAHEPVHYIAPTGTVNFDEAYIVALLFYKRALLDGKSAGWAINYPYALPGIRADYRFEHR